MKVYHRPPVRSIGFAMPNYLEATFQQNYERTAPPLPAAAVVAAPSVTPPEQSAVGRETDGDDAAA